MISYNVRLGKVSRRSDRNLRRPWRFRWSVGHKRFEELFETRALADSFRSELMAAARAGEGFDDTAGRPSSMKRQRLRTTWYEHACAYVAMKWSSLAGQSRRSIADALTVATMELVTSDRDMPERRALKRVLGSKAFNVRTRDEELTDEEARVLDWIRKNSMPIHRLLDDPAVTRRMLNACTLKVDGDRAAATTIRRRKAVLYNALGYAVELGYSESNPIDKIQWKAPDVASEVDRRVVASTWQVERILEKLPEVHPRGDHYRAFFGAMYYAGMRPSEVAHLKRADLSSLPESGWGRLTLVENAPRVGAAWSDTGQVREVRALKHRARKDVRSVPIPPELVELLREHLATFGTSDDGRVFRAARGGYVSEGETGRIWRDARACALSEGQVVSPLAARPYDLRHAAVSLWLNNGVPATEVARRVGHGVEVLLRVYAGCVDGDEAAVNEQIDDALEASRGRGQLGGKPIRRGRPKRQTRRSQGR